MPLGSRDILLVLRARNEASGVFRDAGRLIGVMGSESRTSAQNMMALGAGLAAIGVAFTAAGAAGTAFFASATMDAVEYNRQAALTLTQVDQVGVSITDIGNIAKRVAKEVPAPFNEMQAVLYDIFSSMNVNVPQAESLLKAFAKEAVAGQVSIQEAGRSTMSIMNSFKIPVEQVNHVLDLQFQLVRKGVGTFGEFSEVIGRVTPAAVAAGQSIETMAGMLAFLTRNGLSTAMASTSAARAMELLTKPDTTSALEKIGVHVKDASGQFLQMNDILSQLVYGKGWGKLTGPQLKQAFQDTFGTGSIQARRFFDLAIPNFEQLKGLTNDMSDSAGAMDEAYSTMADTTAVKMQELANRFDIVKVNIGEKLMPIIERLADAFTRVLDAWEGLDPGTQDMIIKFGLIASVLAVVVGVILTVVGVFLIFAGAAAAAGVSLVVVAAVVAAIVAAFVLLAGIVYLVIQNWDTIKAKAEEVWPRIQALIQSLVDWWNNTFLPAMETAKNFLVQKWDELVGWWNEHVGPLITAVMGFMMAIYNVIQFVWDLIQNFWEAAGTPILVAVQGVWNTIYEIISGVLGMVWNVVVAIWNGIKGFIEGILQALTGVFQFFTGVLTLNWELAWTGIKNFVSGIWDAIFALITGALGAIKEVITGVLSTVWNVIRAILQGIWDTIQSIWTGIQNKTRETWEGFKNTIVHAIDEVLNLAMGFTGRLGGYFHIDLTGIGRAIMNSFLDGLKSGWNDVTGFIGGIGSWIHDHKGPPSKDATLLIENGNLIMDSLGKGLDRGWKDVQQQLMGYNPMISGAIGVGSNGAPVGSYGSRTRGGAITIQEGAFVFHIDNAQEDVEKAVQRGIQGAFSQLADEWAGFNASTP